jgi:hypothetical protein
MTSSTKRFQNDRDTGTEAKALCSTSSITKLAITVDTGDPSLFQKPVDNNSPQTQSMWCCLNILKHKFVPKFVSDRQIAVLSRQRSNAVFVSVKRGQTLGNPG